MCKFGPQEEKIQEKHAKEVGVGNPSDERAAPESLLEIVTLPDTFEVVQEISNNNLYEKHAKNSQIWSFKLRGA